VAPTKVSGDPPLDGPQGFPTEKQGERQSSLPAPAPTSAPLPAAAIEKAPPGGTLSEAEISALVQRGDSLFAQGDVASARLFYKRAAIAGNGTAALRLGNSFDSVFLNRVGMGGVHGDVSLATRWYYRALELGEDDAAVLLTALAKKNEN
jgi:TPR repeat protein